MSDISTQMQVARFSHRAPCHKVRAVSYEHVQPVAPSLFQAFAPIRTAPAIEISYSDFVKEVGEGGITRVELAQNNLELRAYTPVSDEIPIQVVLPAGNDVAARLLQRNVDVVVHKPQPVFDFQMVFMYAFEFLILTMLVRMMFGGMSGAGSPFRNMGDSQARLDEEPKTGVTFDDVAGCDNAKRDLKETVDFLKNPEKYEKLGAKMPKGVLLVGQPGTGKTKLARAVAGEAEVPFFSCSGSEFIEMFVGVGSARVRSLFKRATEKAPCIIFIDEIDAIGKKRGNSAFGGHEEHDQTINQLLTLMDGFTPSAGIVVIAATNRPEILDDALLRPGRFDRQVIVDLPDIDGRRQILDLYTKKKPIAEDVDITSLAKCTVGFSGAELENLCNEACIQAARRNSATVTTSDFDMALDKLTLGEERNRTLFDEHKRRVIAYHEAGHAVIALALKDNFDKIRKISIIPRGGTGGATYFEPQDEHGLVSREYLENQIMVALGGRIAEELVFEEGEVTNGASGDFMRVTELAREMITTFGFGSLPPMNFSESEGMITEIEQEMNTLVEVLYDQARTIMLSNEELLHRIAEELLEKETMDEDDIDMVININL